MNVEVHYLRSHLDRFPENLGDLSEEPGERFHQDIKTLEAIYQGRWDAHMIADYCWNPMRDRRGRFQSRKFTKGASCVPNDWKVCIINLCFWYEISRFSRSALFFYFLKGFLHA
jgi:hypothetical protein